jgi:protease-4
VFYGKADVSRLLERIGVDVEVYKTAEGADADAFYRPYSSTERAQLERQLQQFYELFLERVADGRKLQKSAVDAVGQGRVWTGEQAKEKGLVDELGGLRQALAHARKLADLPVHAPIIELPRLESSLIGRLLGVSASTSTFASTGNGAAEAGAATGALSLRELARGLPREALLGRLEDVAEALGPFLLHSSQQPLMRLEDFVVQP